MAPIDPIKGVTRLSMSTSTRSFLNVRMTHGARVLLPRPVSSCTASTAQQHLYTAVYQVLFPNVDLEECQTLQAVVFFWVVGFIKLVHTVSMVQSEISMFRSSPFLLSFIIWWFLSLVIRH